MPRAFDWRRAQLTLDPDCDWSKVGPITQSVNLACCTRESPCNGEPPRVCPSGECALVMADLRADPCAPSLEHLLDTAGGEKLVREMMQEVIAAAEADGHPLPPQIIDSNIDGTRKMPAYKNSMALDYLNDRPIELDAILGNVVAIAQKHGVPVPRLETMLAALRMRA